MSRLLKKIAKHRLQFLGLALVIAGALSLTILSVDSSSKALNPTGLSLDLISGQDWSHFAGALQTTNGVEISPLGRAIVNQDGGGGQPNPPFNARGPRLSFRGTTRISYQASNIPTSGAASLYLYSAPPIIYDEWRYEPAHIRIDQNRSTISVYEWDGESDKPKASINWNTNLGQEAYISLVIGDKAKDIKIEVNGLLIGTVKSNKVFSSGNVWFGADAALSSQGWTIKSLAAKPIAVSKFKVLNSDPINEPVSADAMSLSSLASFNPRHLLIGAAISNYAFFTNNGYRRLSESQLSMLVPENELKPQFVHPQPNIYSFTEADSLVDFALSRGMTVHGHTLEFSEANPKWMQQAPISQRQKILTDHINTVVSHYVNKINEWDVVDEPLNDNNDNNANSSDLRQNIWYQAMGEGYIDKAFEAAHTASPSAKLYINEYGLEADGSRWDEFLSLLKRLQARGVPIDGVGFQAHVHEPGDEIETGILENHMKILTNMGLASRISEIDVYGDDAQHQADQYSAALKACLSSPNCTSYTMWGLSDKYGSTTDIHKYPIEDGNDLVWDENMQPKIAYKSLQSALENH